MNRISHIVLAIFLAAIPVLNGNAAENVKISKTRLFTKLATECKNIEYEKWEHPLRKVFSEMYVLVREIQLCNNNKYPIFYLGIGPLGEPDYKVYEKSRTANGSWPFAFVIPGRGEIIYVSYPKNSEPKIEYEYFSEDFDQEEFFEHGGFEKLTNELKHAEN
jgi:hypothetical protein